MQLFLFPNFMKTTYFLEKMPKYSLHIRLIVFLVSLHKSREKLCENYLGNWKISKILKTTDLNRHDALIKTSQIDLNIDVSTKIGHRFRCYWIFYRCFWYYFSLSENSGKGKIGKPSAIFGKKLRRLIYRQLQSFVTTKDISNIFITILLSGQSKLSWSPKRKWWVKLVTSERI